MVSTLPGEPPLAVPLSILSVPLHTCRSAADRDAISNRSTQVNKERPSEYEGLFASRSQKRKSYSTAKKKRQSKELWGTSPIQTQTDYKLEKHLLWLRNFSNLKQTPAQTYKFKKFIHTG